MKTFLKYFFGLFIFGITLLAIMVAAGSVYFAGQFEKPGPHANSIEFMVPRGANIGNVAENLHEAGVIEGALAMEIFVFGARFTEQAGKIKAGEYEIPPHASMKEILDLLESGKVIQRQITIREGLTNWEIKQLLLSHDGLSKGSEFKMKAEGMYLPETYSYQKNNTPADLMHRMNIALERTLNELWASRAPDLPFKTKEEALVLASIIEKETAVPSERKRVAGVFVNRLRKGMLLQTDPTVIYALTLGKHKNEGQGPLGRRLLKKDLAYDSPYNTYKYAGLPPGPICNPGRASIEAALNPEEHDYLYFVADGTGGHAFAKNLAGHNRNVAKWRKIRKSQ